MNAIWFHTVDIVDDCPPLWTLERADGFTIAESADRPTAAGNRELAEEWDVTIDTTPVYRFAAMGDLL